MFGESHDSFDHWHLITPDGAFSPKRFDSEAAAVARATVLQCVAGQTERFYHILGVPSICICKKE